MRQLHQLAERYARLPRDSPIAHELVTDVIGDMVSGDLAGDPARDVMPQLAAHVFIRAKHWLRANERRQPDRNCASSPVWVSLDEAPASALARDAPQLEPDRARDSAVDPADLVARTRALAQDDELALRLLALHEEALRGDSRFLRHDALRAGMTDWTYRASRERLVGYAATAVSAARAISGTPAVASTGDVPEHGDAPDAMLPLVGNQP